MKTLKPTTAGSLRLDQPELRRSDRAGSSESVDLQLRRRRLKIMVVMGEYPVGGRERRRQAVFKCASAGKDLYSYGHSHVPGFFESDSAVEGEAQDKAQAFCSERNGPVPLSAVAGVR